MPEKHIGKVVQITGPVLDIRFKDGELPALLNAVELDNHGKKLVVEVAQHIGDNVARCIAMAATDGLVRGADAVDTGGRERIEIVLDPGERGEGQLFIVRDTEERGVLGHHAPILQQQTGGSVTLRERAVLLQIRAVPRRHGAVVDRIAAKQRIAHAGALAQALFGVKVEGEDIAVGTDVGGIHLAHVKDRVDMALRAGGGHRFGRKLRRLGRRHHRRGLHRSRRRNGCRRRSCRRNDRRSRRRNGCRRSCRRNGR